MRKGRAILIITIAGLVFLTCCPLFMSVAQGKGDGSELYPVGSPGLDSVNYASVEFGEINLMGICVLIAITIIFIALSRAAGRAEILKPVPPEKYTRYGATSAANKISPNLNAQIEDLRKSDPLFSMQRFDDFVSTVFFKIQEAWTKGDMNIASAFVTPSLRTRFQSQLDAMRNRGLTNKVEKISVKAVDIVEANHDGGYNYVTAKIIAAAAEYKVNNKTGEIVEGTKEVYPFTEFWTFLRSDKVKTAEGNPELISQKCPNCGGPIRINAVGQCDYCGSDITSGKFSWVLSEITQGEAWKPRVQAMPMTQASPLAGQRYILGLVQCPNCGANVQDIQGITHERCWRCGATVPTEI